jgi:arylsulfatase A-like enzyme
MKAKPNVLFLFTDDQRFDTINAWGNSEIHTPNLDQLVREGFSFRQAHIPGGTVGAVCMPSRAMVHTGRNLFSLEEDGERIPENHSCLGEVLQKEGYRTFGTGKWHNGIESYARSFTDGAEIFFGGMWDHWNVPANNFDPTGQYEKAANFISDFYYDNHPVELTCDHTTPGVHSTDLFTDATLVFLDNYSSDSPWFAYVSYMAPHDPRSMPKEFLDLYSPSDIELPPNFSPEHAFEFGIRSLRDEVLEEYPRTMEKIKTHIAEYYAMISHLDSGIGKIINKLKENGNYENTIIIFAGDNGLSIGQHGLMGKQNNYEHSVRVPLIFSGPGIPKNSQSDEYVFLMDIFPTILDLVGCETPASSEAISLEPIIRGEGTGRDNLYLAFRELTRAVKTKQYKLIEYNTSEGVRTQLFDLINDPWETNDLSISVDYYDVMTETRQTLYKERDQNGDLNHPAGRVFWDFYQENINN